MDRVPGTPSVIPNVWPWQANSRSTRRSRDTTEAWTESEGKKDQEILAAALNPQPRWPWSTTGDFAGRLAEATAAPNTSGKTKKGEETPSKARPSRVSIRIIR